MLFAGKVRLLFIVVPLEAEYEIPVSDEFILFIVLFKELIWFWPLLVKSTYPAEMESELIAPVEILLDGKETIPLETEIPPETEIPLEQATDPLSTMEGSVTVPEKVGLIMFAFKLIWFEIDVAKVGSLFMAAFISWRVFKRFGLVPTREEIAVST